MQKHTSEKGDLLNQLSLSESFREAWVEVNLGNIRHNIQQALTISECKAFFAVVKANGYGHGDVAISSIALSAGAKKLCVATLDEALRLRKYFSNAEILILGAVAHEYIPIAADNNIELTVIDVQFARALRKFKGKPLKVHLKVDTGMNRLGLVGESEILETDRILNKNKCLVKEGIFSHYHSADSVDESHTLSQLSKFKALVAQLDVNSYRYVHISNSAGMVIVNKDESIGCGRLGILMYGINPGPRSNALNDFKPALSLKAKVVHIKQLEPGETVGYSRGFVASKRTMIGILPIGYADGLWRYNEGKSVSINNVRYKIVGRISMDQCMIEIDSRVCVGDVATLYGEEIDISKRAEELNTIPYELLCGISSRVPRRYINAPLGALEKTII